MCPLASLISCKSLAGRLQPWAVIEITCTVTRCNGFRNELALGCTFMRTVGDEDAKTRTWFSEQVNCSAGWMDGKAHCSIFYVVSEFHIHIFGARYFRVQFTVDRH